MGRKVFGVLIGLMVLATVVPLTSAQSHPVVRPTEQINKTYTNCYIESDGILEFGNVMHKLVYLKLLRHAFVLFWLIEWDNTNDIYPTTVTVYSSKGGDVLWTNEGQEGIWGLHLLLYRGIYTQTSTEDGRLIIHLEGNTAVAITHTGD
jgi:hypothetical protein